MSGDTIAIKTTVDEKNIILEKGIFYVEFKPCSIHKNFNHLRIT